MRISRVIWFALLMAMIIYCIIAFILGQKNAATPFAAEFHDPLIQIVYAVAAVTFAMAFFMRGWMRDHDRPARIYNIVCWAMLEAVTIYGLMLAFVKYDWRLIIGPAAFSLAGFVITFPQED